MAKIPRLTGDVGGGGTIPSGGGVPASLANVTAPLAALGDVAEAGYKIAAHAEKSEALRKQQLEEAKQGILNEVEAGRIASTYQEDLFTAMETAKTEYAAKPEDAPEAVLNLGRSFLDDATKDVSNSAVGLAVAQRANSHLDSAVAQMHVWAQARKTQKAKADLDEEVNKFTAAAEKLPTVEALNAHLRSADTYLAPALTNALGEDGAKRLHDAKGEAAEAWARVQGMTAPFMVAGVLDNAGKNGNPFGPYTTGDQRAALRKATEAAAEGLVKTREYEQIKKDIAHGGKIAQAYLAGNAPVFAGLVVSERGAIAKQRAALDAQISNDTAALKALGIDPKGKTDVALRGLLDDREKFVNALDHANRRQISLTAQDDPSSVAAFAAQMNKALRTKTGRSMKSIAEQQTRLAVLLAEEKVSGATASTYFTTMANAMSTAADNQEDVWGPNTVRAFHAPREAGIVELNSQMGGFDLLGGQLSAGPFAKLSPEDKAAARLEYESMFNAAIAAGQTVDAKAARRMALRAIAYRTGKRIPGAD